ncbi:phytanoyl-CoA dioxygenase family protein [Novosphingobium sp. RL4]|uniref:phytanoyl-CoA dioxygenase family protein n=1 Tax=Novosphingobium sp. RL4 TaxID=3109595 RepID=UPI002D781686|nr:phytanoyl-CoA dioxygenase family protein [Novosphingobium sp. RL4]WRT94466.1 phytanoyl-CoA dioxygenase family protein [Novosphingobium sp. RL4]
MSTDLAPAMAQHLSPMIAADLKAHGYAVLRGIIDPNIVDALDRDLAPAFETTPFCNGEFYGPRTKRFGRVLLRSPLAERFVRHEAILSAVHHILSPWCDTIQLNLTQGLALHPGAPAQFPHRDQDMWRGVTGEIEYLVNVMWPFTTYHKENGTTLVWPRSHGAAALQANPPQDPVAIDMQPGDALLFLGSPLHGAGTNRSEMVRRGMIVSYCLGWLKPYENQWLAYPPAIARRFSPELAALVGYTQHRPNLGNYEGLCPSVLLGQHPADLPGATDALRPDQEEALAEWSADQGRST